MLCKRFCVRQAQTQLIGERREGRRPLVRQKSGARIVRDWGGFSGRDAI